MPTNITITETVQNVTVNNTTDTITVTPQVQSITVSTSPSKTDIGLGNVDNTSDINKPVSTATQSAIDALNSSITTTLNSSVATLNSSIATKANINNPTFTGGAITVDPSTVITWGETSNRLNRLEFQSSNGTTSGIRVVAPVATGGQSTASVITTDNPNNTQFLNMQAVQGSGYPLRITTGKYVNGTLTVSGASLSFIDGGSTTPYATLNPSGPINTTDLATKYYVDNFRPRAADVLTDGTATTDALPEGTTNKYYTDARVGTYLTNNSYAKTSDITTAVNAVIGGAPGALDTLKELADAIADDANFASTITASLATKANTSSLATVATTGSYTDLTNKPTIPTVPTTVSSFTNDSGYVTASGARSAISAGTGITYNSATGVIGTSITQYTDAMAKAAITGGTGVTVTSGSVAIGQSVATTADVTFNSVSANLANAKYILGQAYVTRNTSWTPPASTLTTIDGTNSIAVASSGGGNGYSPNLSVTYYSGDTTSGTNSSAVIATRGATGTNSSPSAAATNQVLGSWNFDGFCTSGWAQSIATTGSGAGTTSLSPLQIQGYAVSAFTDSAGTVTNAPMGFRVRGFASSTSMSSANRLNFIDHTLATAVYKAGTFNIQSNASTANYATFGASTGSINQDTLTLKNNASTTTYATFSSTSQTIGGVDNPINLTRVRGASAGTSPSLIIRNSNTVAAAPASGDGTTFRFQTAGSNATNYTIAEIAAQYNTGGDDSVSISIANGDQTTGTFTGVQTLTSKITSTTISAGTASGTAGGSSVATKLTVDANKITPAVPVAFPSYTSTQRDALTPSAGWVLFNSTTAKLQVYTGAAWADLN
jgi:hypothetical protein